MLCFFMADKKKRRQLDLEAKQRMKRKDRGFFDNEVAGQGSMQKPKIGARQVEDGSLHGKNPEEIVVGGRRLDWDPSRSR